MKRYFRLLLIASTAVFVYATDVVAQVPSTMSVTSVLRDAEGARLEGNFLLTYRLYDAEEGSTALWEESQGVELVNGILQATLGLSEPLDLPFDTTYWVGLTINSGDELTPRLSLTSSPYAINAKRISEDAVVAGSNVTIVRNESNQLVISAEGGPEPVVGNTLNASDGSPENAVFVDAEGRVGVGRDNPIVGAALSVNGPISFTNRADSAAAADNPLLYVFESGTDNATRGVFAHSPDENTTGLFFDDAADKLHFTGSSSPALTIGLNSQRVGIRNASPAEALSVGGVVQSTTGGFRFPDGSLQTSAAVNGFTPWNASASNIYFNTGNVGIGDNTPLATLTVGNGDKLQIHGADGDVVFNDDEGSLRFSNVIGESQPMIQMFQSGTNNATRMLVAHSPSFPTWGIQYNDTTDTFHWIGDNLPVFNVQLAGQQRIGVGTFAPEAKVHVATNSAVGFGHLKLTETQFDYSRITMNNNIASNYWDIAARTDADLANAQFNVYHSDVGDILSVNARGRVGVNDSAPGFALEVNGNGGLRAVNVYNTLPTTTVSTFNYGVYSVLSQAANSGFPRLINIYGSSTDSDSYLSYGVYGRAENASNFNYGVYGESNTASGYAVFAAGNTYSTGAYLPSDEKLKNNIRVFQGGLDKLMALSPILSSYDTQSFKAMNLPSGDQFGFVAADVKAVMPELVKRTLQPFEELDPNAGFEQGIEFEAVNYTGMIPVLVSAIQEQQAVITALRAEVDALKAAVNR